jgi:ketopantoate reductase
MPLIEALTLQVGPAIAKAILKVWLKDRKFASDIASSLMDLLKSKTADVIAQRRASRHFEEIGEKVAESLLPVFEMEGAHLDESSCTAVALAVAETLNKSSIDADCSRRAT